MHSKKQNLQGVCQALANQVNKPFALAATLAGGAGLAVLLGLAPGAGATELLANGSFDQGGAGWVVAAAGTNADFFGTAGEANLHGNGYLGTLVWQDLDVPNAAGLSGTARLSMNKYSGPPGNSIALYLDYTVASGATNRLLLINPDNNGVISPPDSSIYSTNFTLPADAQRLVRFAVDKTYFGLFHAQELSLDVDVVAGPDLGLSITGMDDGSTLAAPVLLRAAVTNLAAAVERIEFFTNGVLLGRAQLDPHGEWEFAGAVHLSVMGYAGYEMVDFNQPAPEPMFFMNGGFTSLTNFTGMFQYFTSESMGGGSVSVNYSLNEAGQLSVAITGEAPMGSRTLSNGTNRGDTISYGLFWAGAPAGTYVVTARGVYGSGLVATSAPVTLTLKGPEQGPAVSIRQSAPGEVELSWPDDGHTYEVLTQASLSPGPWISAPGSSQVDGGKYIQILPSTNASAFFRLRRL